MLPRKASVEVIYDGSDITQAVSDSIMSFTYSDKASGEADDVQLVVHDREKKWHDEWYPKAQSIEAPVVGNSDYSEIAAALQRGTSAANLQRLIDESDLTPEQGRILQRVTPTSGWPQFVNWNPQYVGESGKLLLVEDIKAGHVTAYERVSRSERSTSTLETVDNAVAGTVLCIKLKVQNWNGLGENAELNCGAFEIDSCEFSGPPDQMTIKAVSTPVASSMRRQKKCRAWENTTLQKIAQDIAGNAKLRLVYDVRSSVGLDRVEQTKQSDMYFLMDLCATYGVSLKVTDNQLVLFEESVYEDLPVVDTFDKYDKNNRIIDYKFSQNTSDTVSKVELVYKDPKSGLVARGEFTPPNPPATGQKLVLNERPGDLRGDNFRNSTGGSSSGSSFNSFNNTASDFNSTRTDVIDNASRICRARCREKNKSEWTCVLKMFGNVKMGGGVNIDMKNWGIYSGKYMVDIATHKTGAGYETTVFAHKVLGY